MSETHTEVVVETNDTPVVVSATVNQSVDQATAAAPVGATTTKPSLFRDVYRDLEADEQKLIADIKAKAQELEALIAKTKGGRYAALAITSLETAVMWAVKHISS